MVGDIDSSYCSLKIWDRPSGDVFCTTILTADPLGACYLSGPSCIASWGLGGTPRGLLILEIKTFPAILISYLLAAKCTSVAVFGVFIFYVAIGFVIKL